MMVLNLQNVHQQKGNWSLEIPAFTVHRGTIVLLLGESGCGKSSLLKLMAGIGGDFTGEIELSDTVPPALMLQNPLYQCITATVHSELAFPLHNLGVPPAEIDERIVRTAMEWDLTENLDRDLHSLSMGELQRVMIAVTLIMERPLTLFDEPTSHLDPLEIQRFYRRLRQRSLSGQTFLLASQNSFEIPGCDEIVLMRQGKIIRQFPSPTGEDYESDLAECGLAEDMF